MATDLPVMRANVEPIIKTKMEYIAKQNDRSLSKEISQACKAWIKKYEEENGTINPHQ